MVALAIQAAAYLTAFWSMWLIGKKSLWGPLVGCVSTLIWIVMAVQTGLWSMILFEMVYLYLDARMVYLWGWPKPPPKMSA